MISFLDLFFVFLDRICINSITSMFVGKSIVLENTKEESIRTKAASRIKRQSKRSRVFSNKNVKKVKKSCTCETFSSSDIEALHHVWTNYMRKILRSTSVDQLSSKAHQFELIGASVAVIESKVSKFEKLQGYIVDTSENTYTIAVPPTPATSSSSSNNISVVSPSLVEYRVIKIFKNSVSLAISLPNSKNASRDLHPSTEPSYLLLYGGKNCTSTKDSRL